MNPRPHRARARWTAILKLVALVPMVQFAGCTLDSLRVGFLQGLVQIVASDIFTATQTTLLNLFQV